jgi:hypothetical protein
LWHSGHSLGVEPEHLFSYLGAFLTLGSGDKSGEAFKLKLDSDSALFRVHKICIVNAKPSLLRPFDNVFSHTTSNFIRVTKISCPAAMQTDAQRGRAGARKIMDDKSKN